MFVCERHILIYDIQYLTYQWFVVDWLSAVDQVDGLLYSIYGVDTDDVNYDNLLCNNNNTNNTTPGCISWIINDCSSTV